VKHFLSKASPLLYSMVRLFSQPLSGMPGGSVVRICLLFAFALSLVAQPASSQNFSNIVFFGDSLTDSGRYLHLPAIIGNRASLAPPGTGAYTTNPGPVWSVALGQRFGIVVKPSDAPGGGNNYAAGGARVVFQDPANNSWSANSQITAYLASTGGHADPNALYIYWIGNNDLSYKTRGGPGNIVNPPNNDAINTLAQQAIGQVSKLAAAGARHILVPNLLAFMSAETAAAAGVAFNPETQFSRNLYTQAVWNGLKANGINFIPADINTVWNNVLLKSGQFGITNTNVNTPACAAPSNAFQCGPANYVTPNADKTYFFADGPRSPDGGFHQTTAVQKIIADYYYGVIVAPPRSP
jgi:outer membrane lipase/esterase